jgi:hypothetical protein
MVLSWLPGDDVDREEGIRPAFQQGKMCFDELVNRTAVPAVADACADDDLAVCREIDAAGILDARQRDRVARRLDPPSDSLANRPRMAVDGGLEDEDGRHALRFGRDGKRRSGLKLRAVLRNRRDWHLHPR